MCQTRLNKHILFCLADRNNVHEVIGSRHFIDTTAVLDEKLGLQIVQKGETQFTRELPIGQAQVAYGLSSFGNYYF